MKYATPEPLIHPRREINIYYLKITQEEIDLLYKKKSEYLWRHPRGDFITQEGVMAIRALRRKKRAEKKKSDDAPLTIMPPLFREKK